MTIPLLLTFLLLIQGPASIGDAAVTGRLLSASGKPVANARVAMSAADDPGVLVAITQTDNEGNYRFNNVRPGRYYIAGGVISSPTFWPGNTSTEKAVAISITAGAVFNVPDFALAAVSGGLTVKGHVSLPSEAKGPGAPAMTVRLTTVRGRSSDETARVFNGNVAADGSFEVSNVVLGRYSISIRPDIILNGPPINVTQDMDDLEIAVPASVLRGTVEATVSLEGNAPMPPVGITLTNENSRTQGPWIFIDGKITILGIPTGEYSLKVTGLPAGYTIKSFTAGDTNLLTQNLKHTYINRPKIQLTLVATTPNPGVHVKGVLTGKDREMLPPGINLSGVTPGLTLNARIQPDGSFDLPVVPQGTYDVEFTTPVDATPVKRTITVGASSTTVEVPVRIAGLARVTVNVNTGQVPANNGRDVQLGRDFPYLQPEGSPGNSGATRARNANDGNIEFLNVAPGRYRVFMATEQPDFRGQGSRGRTLVSSGPGITITVTDKDVTVDLPRR